jgi:hypothetical protein
MIDPIARTVFSLMSKFGGPATLVSKATSEYDPNTSTNVITETTKQLRVMVFDYIPKFTGMGTENGSLIRAGDKQVFVSPSPGLVFQSSTDAIMWQGKKYDIVAVKELNPSGTKVLLFEIFVRE